MDIGVNENNAGIAAGELYSSLHLPNASSTPYYVDDDLMVIDNIKFLSAPESAARTNMNLIAFCAAGRFQAEVNGERVEVRSNQIFITPPGISFENVMVSPDFEYYALCVTSRALRLYMRRYISVWNRCTYVDKIRVIDVDEEVLTFYRYSFELVKFCLKKCADPADAEYHADMLRGTVSSMLTGLCNVLRRHSPSVTRTGRGSAEVFSRFLGVLQATEAKHSSVEYYASRLCISAKYLTVICKKNSDKTAVDWIREYTLSDVVYYLRNTELSVKEISNKLGFSNTSFFGKYVREHLGCTPVEYRRRHSTIRRGAGGGPEQGISLSAFENVVARPRRMSAEE